MTKKKWWLIVGTIVVLIGAVGGGTYWYQSSQQPSTEKSAHYTLRTKQNNETIAVGNFKIGMKKVDKTEVATKKSDNAMTLWQISTEIENITSNPASIGAIDFTLKDTNGKVYNVSPNYTGFGKTLNAGEKSTEKLYFELPNGKTPAKISYKGQNGSTTWTFKN